MRPSEQKSHLSNIEGLKDVLNSPEAKTLISEIKVMLIKTALKWLESLINKLTKTKDKPAE